jgi:hypothetical protein
VNQIESSDFTTTSFGRVEPLALVVVGDDVMRPSISVRVTRRLPCSHETSRPWRSTVWPLA